MRNIFIIVVMFVCAFAFSQETEEEQMKIANRLYNKSSYSVCIPLYETILISYPDNREANLKLGDCYYYTNDNAKAIKRYKVVIDREELLRKFKIEKNTSDMPEEDYYWKYSHALKAMGDAAEANRVRRDFYTYMKRDKDLERLNQDIATLENISTIGDRYKIQNLAINTPNTEFGGVVLGEKLVFASSTSAVGVFDKVDKWNNETYLSLYSANVNEAKLTNTTEPFSKELASASHESNAVFTKDGKTIYFTTTRGRKGNNSNRVSTVQIYRADLDKDKWTNITRLPFCSDEFSVEHPALSPDEKTLYFSSDKEGNFDIFSVQIKSDKDYGTPVNLGKPVNTDKREQFPFVSMDNKLYFSSNGHEGYGSLDIFVSNISKEKSYSKPMNVGLPVNSGFDDFAYYIDTTKKEGFFSSNRPEGKGRDDIYWMLETKPLSLNECTQTISGVITEIARTAAVKNATITLQSEDGKPIRSIKSPMGKYIFTVTCKKKYIFVVTKDKYEETSLGVSTDEQNGKNTTKIIEIKALENPEDNSIVELLGKDGKKLNKKEKQLVIMDKEKDLVIKDRKKLIIKTEPIYFDFQSATIRPDAQSTLSDVVELMKKYADMEIEIISHTDCRGDAKFNLELSTKRANATKLYIVQQGIKESRIEAKGLGEKELIIKCEPEDSCPEEVHELNRRSEFIIKKL